MEKFVAKPSCLSCVHAKDYLPYRCRSTVKQKCKLWGFDVDAGSVPGRTVACDRFATPEVPFAYETVVPMPAHLL